MPRIRTIKPEFPQSESMGRVSREARLCFCLLWTVADDDGRARGSSRLLASLLYPYDGDAFGKIDNWLDELVREKCIVLYEIDGTRYLQICNWLEHQKIDKPSKSKLPPFEKPREVSAKAREASATDLGPGPGPGPVPGPSICTETDEPSAVPKAAEGLKAVMTFPCDGEPRDWALTSALVAEWQESFPSLDVVGECRHALAWVKSKSAHRKTASGMRRFLVGWLGRAQNAGRSSRDPPFAKPASSEVSRSEQLAELFRNGGDA